MAAERSLFSEVPPKTDCQPRHRPSRAHTPRADADFTARWLNRTVRYLHIMAGWLPEVVNHVRAARNVRIDQRTAAPSGTLDAQHAIEPADVE